MGLESEMMQGGGGSMKKIESAVWRRDFDLAQGLGDLTRPG